VLLVLFFPVHFLPKISGDHPPHLFSAVVRQATINHPSKSPRQSLLTTPYFAKRRTRAIFSCPPKPPPRTPELAQKSGNRKSRREKTLFSSEGRRIQPKMLEVIELICCRMCSCLAAVVGLVIKSMSNEKGSQNFLLS
jgi:hypothetical protein